VKLFISILLFLSFLVGSYLGDDYRKIHSDAIVVDTHNDVVQRMLKGADISFRTTTGHSDLERFREGGIDIQFFSIWVPPQQTKTSYFNQAIDQINCIESFVNKNSDKVALAKNSDDIDKFIKDGKFIVMLGMEGGHPLDDDISKLVYFYNQGVRYLTLTWNNSTSWATSAMDEEQDSSRKMKKGVSPFGKKIIQKMNELGMIIDVSHLGEKAFWDVIQTTKKPVIASHSCVWALCPNRRNLKDEQIKAIAKTGGAVFINFAAIFVDSTFARKEKILRERNKTRIDSFRTVQTKDESLKSISVEQLLRNEYLEIRPPLSKLIDHIDYIAKLVGTDYIGLGSDFDGISVTPLEMDDVSYIPNITRELLKRGYSVEDIKKILGDNFLRILKSVEVN
jgi:membrane dipeptidase